jgi:hypothetical protein
MNFKYLHTLTIDCADACIPVEMWNICSTIPSLTSFSIFNLNVYGKYEQCNEHYWKSMNICPTLIKSSLSEYSPCYLPTYIQTPNLTS